MTAKLVEVKVIVSDDIIRGAGTLEDRTRGIRTVYSLDGEVLGEYDPTEDPDNDEMIELPLHIFTNSLYNQ